MIDEVVCYIESPEEIQCEINQVVIKWEGEYYPYKGKYEIWPTKEDQVLETAKCYLDQNIVVHKAQFDPYIGEYTAIPIFNEDTVLDVKEKYMTQDFTIKKIEFKEVAPGREDGNGGYIYYIGSLKNTTNEGDNDNE